MRRTAPFTDQTADRRAVRKLTATLVTALAASCGAFVLLGYLLRDHFSPRPEFGVLVQDLPVHTGTYVLRAEFVASDHAPFNPRVYSPSVVFTVK